MCSMHGDIWLLSALVLRLGVLPHVLQGRSCWTKWNRIGWSSSSLAQQHEQGQTILLGADAGCDQGRAAIRYMQDQPQCDACNAGLHFWVSGLEQTIQVVPESHHPLTAWPTGQMLSLDFCTYIGLFRIRWCSPAMLRRLARLRQGVKTVTSEGDWLEVRASSSHRLEAAHRLQLLDLPLICLKLLSKCKQLVAPPLTLLEAVEVCGRLQRNISQLPHLRICKDGSTYRIRTPAHSSAESRHVFRCPGPHVDELHSCVTCGLARAPISAAAAAATPPTAVPSSSVVLCRP